MKKKKGTKIGFRVYSIPDEIDEDNYKPSKEYIEIMKALDRLRRNLL